MAQYQSGGSAYQWVNMGGDFVLGMTQTIGGIATGGSGNNQQGDYNYTPQRQTDYAPYIAVGVIAIVIVVIFVLMKKRK